MDQNIVVFSTTDFIPALCLRQTHSFSYASYRKMNMHNALLFTLLTQRQTSPCQIEWESKKGKRHLEKTEENPRERTQKENRTHQENKVKNRCCLAPPLPK